MKKLLLAVSYISIAQSLMAQVPTAMPPDANTFYLNAMPVIRQQVRNIVLQTAAAIKYRKANADSLFQKLSTNKNLKSIGTDDIEGIVVLTMVQASKDIDTDLKLIVLEMSHRNETKQNSGVQIVSENNAENKNRTIEEINEMKNAKLQTIMERKRKMAEEISNVMTKILGVQQNIINNLK